MFEASSRYANLPDRKWIGPDGESFLYKTRRLLPQGARQPRRAEETVRQGERLDLFAARTLGDPLQFWRVADANDSMSPFELVVVPGRRLVVPVPQVEGATPSLER